MSTGEPEMRYSRIVVLMSINVGCVALNYWLITNGYYRAPLFVLLACILIGAIALPRLPPLTRGPKQIYAIQQKAGKPFRRLGYLFIGGFVVTLFNYLSGGLKGMPPWGAVFMFCWGGFLIWGCFWMAKRYESSVASRSDTLPVHASEGPSAKR
jgi:RsiW-degrading membrane proteinase PrsW (M82 family)